MTKERHIFRSGRRRLRLLILPAVPMEYLVSGNRIAL